MSTKDFPPRPQGAAPDSDSMLNWLDKLRDRQNIDAQQELTSVATGDEILVFDVSETGNVKTKKATVSNIAAGAGAVIGPASATDNGFVKFNGTTGKLVKDSAATVAISSEVSGLGTGVATFLATPSSANLASAVTDETGSGALVFAATPTFSTTIGVGAATAAASGAGVTFPATQSASSDPNTLDDYEEGTFTAGISFGGGTTGITYSTQLGRYTKIGNCVHYTHNVRLTSKGTSTGTALGTGLPFTSAAGTDGEMAGSQIANAMAATATTTLQGGPLVSSTTIGMNRFTAGAAAVLTDADFNNNTVIRTSGIYFV